MPVNEQKAVKWDKSTAMQRTWRAKSADRQTLYKADRMF